MDKIRIEGFEIAQQLTHGQRVEADLVGLNRALPELLEQLTTLRAQLDLMPALDHRRRKVERIGGRVRVIDSLVEEEDSHELIAHHSRTSA